MAGNSSEADHRERDPAEFEPNRTHRCELKVLLYLVCKTIMVFDKEQSIGCFCRKSAFSENVYNLTFSKSNRFIFVPNCTEVVNMVKFPPATFNI